jgi:hypothetical protein
MDKNTLGKRIQVDKANQLVFASTGITIFIFIFTIFAAKSLISQGAYQNRVISKQNAALANLKSDINDVNNLTTSYQAFIGEPQNLIGGNPSGTGQNDGNNSKIILDALPTSYDANAWTLNFLSLNTLLGQGNTFLVLGGGGSSSSTTSSSRSTSSTGSTTSSPTAVSLSGSFTTSINNIGNDFGVLNRSILPIQVLSMNFSANQNSQADQVTFTAQTYYQAPYQFSIGQVTVR